MCIGDFSLHKYDEDGCYLLMYGGLLYYLSLYFLVVLFSCEGYIYYILYKMVQLYSSSRYDNHSFSPRCCTFGEWGIFIKISIQYIYIYLPIFSASYIFMQNNFMLNHPINQNALPVFYHPSILPRTYIHTAYIHPSIVSTFHRSHGLECFGPRRLI